MTTMAAFEMCEACRHEYLDPNNRRFHAQPIACPTCGPQLALFVDGAIGARQDAAVREAQRIIAEDGIVAVKGLGGFHLACDARSDRAVQTLRERKGRSDKPFAVMALDLAAVERIAEMNETERTLLMSHERPIVLLNKKANARLSSIVSPGHTTVGVMLPYTPLHYLLLSETQSQVLVMTSGNLSDEPIVTDNDEAIAKLGTLADAILMHDRDIHVPCDDSVMRVFEHTELPIRRSRGYAPFPVKLPFHAMPTLAAGGELKATFCLAVDEHAFMSQHIGDMQNLETMQAFERAMQHMQALFRISPEIIVADLHPGYLSSQWAEAHAQGRRLVKVQHHHAHIAAVMAEHGLPPSKSVIGVCFDGTGYGMDGAIWGGEVLIASYASFHASGALEVCATARWRCGHQASVSHARWRICGQQVWIGLNPLPPVAACSDTERRVLRHQLETGLNAAPTSSMGRLFDAVAALAGVRQHVPTKGKPPLSWRRWPTQPRAHAMPLA